MLCLPTSHLFNASGLWHIYHAINPITKHASKCTQIATCFVLYNIPNTLQIYIGTGREVRKKSCEHKIRLITSHELKTCISEIWIFIPLSFRIY